MDPRARPQHDPDDDTGREEPSPPAGEAPGLLPPPRKEWQGWAPQRPSGVEPRPNVLRPAPRAADGPALREGPPAENSPAPVGDGLLPAVDLAPELRREHSRNRTREVVETALLAILVFLVVRASFQNFRVQGHSMYPNLHDGELVVVSPLLYKRIDTGALSDFLPFVELRDGQREVFTSPSRGDIVVFHSPGQQRADLVKRIIGLPGETVQIVNGAVYIDDHRLDEPYITESWSGDLPQTFIPDDYYFVLGDNRNNSEDSRSPRVGLVARNQIIGKALFRWWPPDSVGRPSQAPGELTDDPPPPPRSPRSLPSPAAPGSR